MNKRVGYILIAIIVFLVGVIIFLIITQGQPQQSPKTYKAVGSPVSQIPSPSTMSQFTTTSPLSAEDTVKNFYSQYITSAANPYRTGAYKVNSYLSDTLKQNIAKMKSVGVNNDPI